jgi:hypothetical protein
MRDSDHTWKSPAVSMPRKVMPEAKRAGPFPNSASTCQRTPIPSVSLAEHRSFNTPKASPRPPIES